MTQWKCRTVAYDDFAFTATMVIGTSTKPRPSTVFAQAAMRAIGRRQRGGEADRAAALARRQFQPRQRVIDLGRRRHRVDDDVGLGEGQVLAAGDLAGDAARRSAVVDIDQPALGGLAQTGASACSEAVNFAPM